MSSSLIIVPCADCLNWGSFRSVAPRDNLIDRGVASSFPEIINTCSELNPPFSRLSKLKASACGTCKFFL